MRMHLLKDGKKQWGLAFKRSDGRWQTEAGKVLTAFDIKELWELPKD